MPFLNFLFNIDGRVRRREFYLFVLMIGAVFLNWWAGLRDIAGRAHVYTDTATDGYLINLLTHTDTHYATLALLVLITYTVVAKRLHDRGRSGLWQLAVLVPVIGWLWLAFELFILPGSPGANRYGPHPTWDPPVTGAPLHIRFKR